MNYYDKKSKITYALGLTVVIEALKRRKKEARKLYLSPSLKEGEGKREVLSLARSANIPVIQNNTKIFSLSEKEACYAILECEKREEDLSLLKSHVLLVEPSNQGNVGTIMRAMASFSIHDLAIITPAADVHSPKTIRSSMGAYFSLRISLFQDFSSYAKQFPSHHYYPFMLDADTSLSSLSFIKPSTLIFGNEARGLPSSYHDIGTSVRIEMEKEVDSLNLDNAASIALYHLYTKS